LTPSGRVEVDVRIPKRLTVVFAGLLSLALMAVPAGAVASRGSFRVETINEPAPAFCE
jgi:hypothetical protein